MLTPHGVLHSWGWQSTGDLIPMIAQAAQYSRYAMPTIHVEDFLCIQMGCVSLCIRPQALTWPTGRWGPYGAPCMRVSWIWVVPGLMWSPPSTVGTTKATAPATPVSVPLAPMPSPAPATAAPSATVLRCRCRRVGLRGGPSCWLHRVGGTR